MRATVAAPFRPAKLPFSVSFVPSSCAVAAPWPVVAAAVDASIGTGVSRTRNASAALAPAATPQAITATSGRVARPAVNRRPMAPPGGSIGGRASTALSRDSTDRRVVGGSGPLCAALRLAGAGRPRVPQRLEFGLRDVAVEHRKRQPGQAKPARSRIARNQLVGDQAVVADAELALHPAVFVDFRVERPRSQCGELA